MHHCLHTHALDGSIAAEN